MQKNIAGVSLDVYNALTPEDRAFLLVLHRSGFDLRAVVAEIGEKHEK